MNPSKPIILRIAVPTPLRQSFDYLAPSHFNVNELNPGLRIRVPFQRREMIGILLETVKNPAVAQHKLKQALAVIDDSPIFTPEILNLCVWAAEYYHHPIGDVLDSALPVLLRQGKPALSEVESYWQLTAEGQQIDFSVLKRAPRQVELLQWLQQHPEGVTRQQLKATKFPTTMLKTLQKKNWLAWCQRSEVDASTDTLRITQPLANEDQQAALKVICGTNDFRVFLLDGVTGSGKTEVYLQAMTPVLEKQKQVLVLVPEIGLTPQTIQRFRERFHNKVVALHSGLSDKERLNAWVAAKNGSAKIIIGTRSAVFTPFADLGLIVVDEEHDISFKQQEGFRYHARDLAIMRAQANNIPIVLGTATPSLETLSRAQQGRYHHLRLPKRAGAALLPQFFVLDIRNKHLEEGISPSLLNAMSEHLKRGEQVMLFLNRRGYAPVFMCHACGWMSKCKRCDARMTFHHEPRRLHCHHCDTRRPIAVKCEDCGAQDLQIIGLGTERLEQALQKHFPALSIARIDRDSTQRKGSIENILESIHRGDHQILIGTQMLAKGHHFPNVTLVGVIDADSGFFSADFRATERMGQLILQVSGRAGRMEKPGTVMIQTHHPDHPLLHQLIRESYHYFAATLLKERENAALPPYSFLALFRADAHNAQHAMHFLEEIKHIAISLDGQIPLWGPVPAPMPRRAGRYRMQLLLQATQRPVLQNFLKRLLPHIDKLPSKQHVRWSLDVDPLEMF